LPITTKSLILTDHLHIVCLDAPSPPDYGGAIDMYYKVQALAAQGNKIILHYFNYNKHRHAHGLEPYCAEINTYARSNYLRSLSFQSPYIIRSRINPLLVRRLNQDRNRILLEGLHGAGLLSYLQEPSRVVLRLHNEESTYYNALASSETNIIRKAYYLREARLIKRFQKQLNHEVKLAALSQSDLEIFCQQGFHNAHFIPCFVPWQEIRSLPGKGEYCLYHGNMEVIENEMAATWLITKVFDQLNIPLVIAGKGISSKLQKLARSKRNVRLIFEPPSNELDALIKDAHINILPSFNKTGVKLKLLHALFYGRFCITNQQGSRGSGVDSLVHHAESADEFRHAVLDIFEMPFEEAQLNEREMIRQLYNNQTNAAALSALW
jgi:glycosyltransferase involved in cell wall biosynthesis